MRGPRFRPMRMLFTLAVFATSLTAGKSAEAKDPRAERRRADLIKRGQKLIRLGQIETGIGLLEDATRSSPDPEPELLLDIANAYDEWGGHCPDAIDAFKRFFAACAGCVLGERGSRDLSLVESRCSADITIDTVPRGAIVQLESDGWGRVAPWTARLKPGAYVLNARRYGYEPKRADLTVDPAHSKTIEMRLERDSSISERDLAMTPSAESPRASPEPEQPAPIDAVERVALADKPSAVPVLSLVGIGAAAAGGIAGAIFTRAALRDADSELRAQSMAEIDAFHSSANRNTSLAFAGFGVAAAGLALGVISYLASAP